MRDLVMSRGARTRPDLTYRQIDESGLMTRITPMDLDLIEYSIDGKTVSRWDFEHAVELSDLPNRDDVLERLRAA